MDLYTEQVYDVNGLEVKEGDIVYRAKFSNLTLHRVLKINKRSIILSCERRTQGTVNYSYSYIVDSFTLEDFKRHNATLSFSRGTWRMRGLILKTNDRHAKVMWKSRKKTSRN
jgi:hypothetical protein